MCEPVRTITSQEDFAATALELRRIALMDPLEIHKALDVLDRWSRSLNTLEAGEIPGVTFLALWLRRGTLEPILHRELGKGYLDGAWYQNGHAKLRAFPVGVVGHWPAGNIEIQPILSLTCALLGGNSSIVRLPVSSVVAAQHILEKLVACDPDGYITRRMALTTFQRDRTEMHQAMAHAVDGALVWGGADAVTDVRALPFPPRARLIVFGPRFSVAAIESEVWSNPLERFTLCRRIARDVWQFDQQACSSPQTLFLERCAGNSPAEFAEELSRAFEAENEAHPRRSIHAALTSTICNARASWLLANVTNKAWFPNSPDWTILLGEGSELLPPTQGRTLSILVVDDLLEAVSHFDGSVQTLGLAMKSRSKEEALVQAAGFHGVDRVVRLGQMHTFGSPWDGSDLIRPMVRMVRHLPSQAEDLSWA